MCSTCYLKAQAYLVSVDGQIALASGCTGLQKAVRYAKDLLHDCILPEIISAALHQLPMLTPSAVTALHYLWPIDAASKADGLSKPCQMSLMTDTVKLPKEPGG